MEFLWFSIYSIIRHHSFLVNFFFSAESRWSFRILFNKFWKQVTLNNLICHDEFKSICCSDLASTQALKTGNALLFARASFISVRTCYLISLLNLVQYAYKCLILLGWMNKIKGLQKYFMSCFRSPRNFVDSSNIFLRSKNWQMNRVE